MGKQLRGSLTRGCGRPSHRSLHADHVHVDLNRTIDDLDKAIDGLDKSVKILGELRTSSTVATLTVNDLKKILVGLGLLPEYWEHEVT